MALRVPQPLSPARSRRRSRPRFWRGHRPLAAALVLLLAGQAGAADHRLLIPATATDPRLTDTGAAHLVAYADAAPGAPDAPLLVWLGGTGGTPVGGPQHLYDTVLQQGYRLVALSYLNTPAVAQVCTPAVLRGQPRCAEQVRQHRAWGEPSTPLLADPAHDAIVPRLTRLLQHLVRSDPTGPWPQYLDGAAPRWSHIVLAGQSQGGGMAAFIAQTRRVAGVLVFSGGWDHGPGGALAGWYARASETPPQRWHASFHVREQQAPTMARIYQQLGIPAANTHALDLPANAGLPHGEGIRNPAYRPVWVQMLQIAP